MNAQGEDVVAGIRTPQTIDQLRDVMPDVYNQFVQIAKTLEKHYKDMQDMEFTIEKRQTVHAPDPKRQADSRCRPENRC